MTTLLLSGRYGIIVEILWLILLVNARSCQNAKCDLRHMYVVRKSGYVKIVPLNGNNVGMHLLAPSAILIAILVLGCCGSGVSYIDNDKCLIVAKNDAVLSCKNTVIRDERPIDAILLKKGRDGLFRVTYFNVSKDSILSISEKDFRIDYLKGCVSLCSTNKVFVLTNHYNRCASNSLSIVCDQYKQIVIDEVCNARITYIGHRDATHIVWIDAELNDGQSVHIPLGISGAENKEAVLLVVEKREKCDYVIQENLYEFFVF